MRYSIITPTLCRPTLLRTCKSLESQTCSDWEHIVIVDAPVGEVPPHPQRKVLHCTHRHDNYGNTCRHDAWTHATGEYVYYLDDDNFLAHPRVLESLKGVTGDWAIFPILRYGARFFNDPPRINHTDTGNFLVRREFAQWPNRPDGSRDGTVDGQFAEALAKQYPYESLGHLRPVLVLPESNGGR
jgi:glycosyltransferase involved in cell wall biosynthesis